MPAASFNNRSLLDHLTGRGRSRGFGWGEGRGVQRGPPKGQILRPEGPKRRLGFMGRGSHPPSPPARGSWGALWAPSVGSVRAKQSPSRCWFWCGLNELCLVTSFAIHLMAQWPASPPWIRHCRQVCVSENFCVIGKTNALFLYHFCFTV